MRRIILFLWSRQGGIPSKVQIVYFIMSPSFTNISVVLGRYLPGDMCNSESFVLCICYNIAGLYIDLKFIFAQNNITKMDASMETITNIFLVICAEWILSSMNLYITGSHMKQRHVLRNRLYPLL